MYKEQEGKIGDYEKKYIKKNMGYAAKKQTLLSTWS